MNSYQAGDPFGGRDPSPGIHVDDALGQISDPEGSGSRRWRALLRWSATSAPVALLLTAGIVLGPRGINLLTSSTLPLLEPVVPVALAALGVLVGLGLGDHRKDDRRLFGAACLVAVVTMVVVSAGFAAVVAGAPPPIARPIWILSLTAGVCAATSLTLPAGNPLGAPTATARVIELGVLLPIVAGGLVLAWLRAGSPVGAAVLVAKASGVTLALAAAAWLLLTRTPSETEERVFAVSALLLVGGVAASLGVSALFGGLVAGVLWRYAGRRPRDTIGRDVLFMQHPLLVLVLLVAGARADLSITSMALGAGYVVLRVVGQLAGGRAAARIIGVNAPRDLGPSLLPPGGFGVAFGLNAVGIVGADALLLLSAVVAGTVGAELVALLLPPARIGE